MIQQDEYNTEWLLWTEIRAARATTLPALTWRALLKLRRVLRANAYTRDQRRAFWRDARAGKWAADVCQACAEQDGVRKVWHAPRSYFVVDGRSRLHGMEVAA